MGTANRGKTLTKGPVRILIACETSGRVRDAFLAKGHDVWSCDLSPTKVPGPHFQCNVLDILGNGWDMMIGHPPCTDLATSGRAWFKAKKWFKQPRSIEFFMTLWRAPIHRICLENPVGIMSTHLRQPDQYLDMLLFGHGQQKKTGLWLKNLPPLRNPSLFRTPVIEPVDTEHQSFGHNFPETKDRGEKRSITFINVAWAMADQWGELK